MKNSLSIVLFALQESAAQNLGAKSWGEGVQVIEEKAEGAADTVYWFSTEGSKPVVSKEDLEQLRAAGLLQQADGKPVSKRLGRTSRRAYSVSLKQLKRAAHAAEHAASRIQVLTQRNKELEKELRIAREANGAAFDVNNFLEQIRSSFKLKPAQKEFKFQRAAPRKLKANAGVPTLMLSDWHWGEVVQPERIEGLNEYNLTVAKERANRVFATTLEVLFHHQAGMAYDGMVVSLAGDMFSGNIHDELRATNEKPIFECLLDLTHTLSNALVQIAAEFPGVYVPAVAGNHGRIDFKPTAKNASVDNYDYLLYKMVEMQVQAKMGSKCNVDFDVSPALDLTYGVYGTRYLLTHGDQLGSSTNSDDFWPSMMRMAAKKKERISRPQGFGASAGFDYMTVGHFHNYGAVSNVIVNGSLKGYCEWVYKKNYAYDRPIQALWITHPDHKIASHIPIYGDEPVMDAAQMLPPITSSAGLRYRR